MNDRELLEMAAKAAGIDGQFVARYAADGYPCDFVGIGRNSATIAPLWNPLTDDGDALRLAVKLNIGVQSLDGLGYSHALFERIEHRGRFEESHGKINPEAATRRAIVRAAAEIGKAM